MPRRLVLLVAEMEADDDAGVQRRLDSFRNAVLPALHYGISFVRATGRDAVRFDLTARFTIPSIAGAPAGHGDGPEPGSDAAAREACRLLVDTVEAAGGIVQPDLSAPYPAGDPGWTDLVEPYEAACAALGRTPMVTPEGDDEGDEGDDGGDA